MNKSMETNKLLTLEEIDEAQKILEELDDIAGSEGLGHARSSSVIMGILATARAYWEMFAIYNDSPSQSATISDDKPHARTIEAIVEALKSGTHYRCDLRRATTCLESILKDL